MIREMKTGRTVAILAAIAALGLGGVAAGCGGGNDSSPASDTQTSEALTTGAQTEKSGDETVDGGVESGTEGTVEKGDDVTATEANRAFAAAEKITGGKATEVERKGDSSKSVKSGNASQTIAFEVEIDKDGEEVDVYLNDKFEVVAIKVSSDKDEDEITGADADRATAAAEKATGGKATEVDRKVGQLRDSKKAESLTVAFKVELDQDGQEVDVYLNQKFVVIATRLES